MSQVRECQAVQRSHQGWRLVRQSQTEVDATRVMLLCFQRLVFLQAEDAQEDAIAVVRQQELDTKEAALQPAAPPPITMASYVSMVCSF